ncbi:MAG: phosphopentomutase [Ruminococcaceae bacterium]|nr:phosphopentomutase [Oscillospiraceae bacterium]
MKRVFLIVLDSCGIGDAPDAKDFGDDGANTIKSISKSKNFNIDTLRSMGYTNIDGLSFLGDGELKSKVARLSEKSKGKDTTIGHWEIAGVVSEKPLPTFPNGFPEIILKEFSEKTGRGVICNKTYSGTEVIKDFGEEHLKTGDLIVYTSADSVFQIAAHESIVPPEKLYEYCTIAREILKGEFGVGRVIARPFEAEYPFKRTANRHDFSIEPPKETMLDTLKNKGFDVIGVGKIHDIFAGKGLTEYVFTQNNQDGMNKTTEYQNKEFNGLCFVNLVDFDMVYGHRRDVDGYAEAVAEFDKWLRGFIKNMRTDDTLIITADHGCDPLYKGTDHTRECVPFVLYGENIEPENLGTINGFDYISKTVKENLIKE